MGGLSLSRIVYNSIWLLLALACSIVFEQLAFTNKAVLRTQEVVILGGVMLISGLIIDIFSLHDSRSGSVVRQSLIFILAASCILFFLSEVQGFFISHGHLMLTALFFFATFRALGFIFNGHWTYPAWMSSGVVLLGNGSAAKQVEELIQGSRGRFLLSGIIPLDKNDSSDGVSGCGSLLARARMTGAKKLVVSFPERRGVMPMKEILHCRMQGMQVMDAPSFYEQVTRKLYVENLTPSHFIFSQGFGLTPFRRGLKRCVDLLCALPGLCLVLPFFPLIALLIRLDSPGSVFFMQTRTGYGGRPFRIIKFRTMRNDAEQQTGAVWASIHDPRVTRLGEFLRKTRLDELPQLFNVILGDMSLVGPRPERPEFISELEKSIPFYSERHYVKPGVTGWAQVRYPYGSSVEDALEKLRYDLYYIKHQSFMLDLEIILKTVFVVFSGRGAR